MSHKKSLTCLLCEQNFQRVDNMKRHLLKIHESSLKIASNTLNLDFKILVEDLHAMNKGKKPIDKTLIQAYSFGIKKFSQC